MKVLALICLLATVAYVRSFQICASTNQPDIVLVVEDSNVLDSSAELQLRSFLAEIANNFHLDGDTSRIAYQLYNDSALHNIFYLNKYTETNDAKSTILTTAFSRSYDTIPLISDALTHTWVEELTVTNGERSCHPTVVILVSYSSYTDPNGVGAPDPTLIANDLTAVRQLKNSGALIITVGVGPKRNPKHLLELASGPEFYHDYPTFDALTTSEGDVIAVQACAYVPDGNFYPCEMRVVQADFVFVVDVSANFASDPSYRAAVVAFMNHTLTPYTYDHVTGVQAALVTYQKDADIQINFNDYDTLAEFLSEADAALLRSCGMYTDRCVEDALDKITNHVYIDGTGYRSTCTLHQIYVFPSDCFNCGDPVPLATALRSSTGPPATQIFVIPLQYGVPPTHTGFWKEYLEIADDASHLWEAQPDPTPIVTEYLHKEAWRAVCRAFVAPTKCPPTAVTTVAPPVTTAAPPVTTPNPGPLLPRGQRPIPRQ